MNKRLCNALLLVAVLSALPAAVQAQFYYTVNNGQVMITSYGGPGGAVTIPSTINVGGGVNLPVTAIGSSAFQGWISITNITIPGSVTSIGYGAFGSCSGLASVTIPNSVTNLGDNAFLYCSGLITAGIGNGVTSLGSYTFEYCTGLASATLGKNVTSVRDGAFYNCPALTGVYFNGNAPGLGSAVFYGDSKATVYYMPGTTNWYTPFGERPAVLWNPQAQASGPSFGVRTNRFGFRITGSSNLVVVVEAGTNLAHSTWSVVGTNTLTNGASYFSDPRWTNYPARFYRLRSP